MVSPTIISKQIIVLDPREFRTFSRREHGQTNLSGLQLSDCDVRHHQTPQTFTSPTAMFDTETYELSFCILDGNLHLGRQSVGRARFLSPWSCPVPVVLSPWSHFFFPVECGAPTRARRRFKNSEKRTEQNDTAHSDKHTNTQTHCRTDSPNTQTATLPHSSSFPFSR